MENLTLLLEKLAEKLGTTTEYLWSVLIKQAWISAITDLLYFILVIIIGVILFKFHKYFSTPKGERDETIYENDEGFVISSMVVVTLLWVIIFITCSFSIGNIINGFFNPEYWALNEVLGLIK